MVTFVVIVLFLICVIIWQSVMISKLKNENIKLINKINDIEKSDINDTDKNEIATSSAIDNNKEKKTTINKWFSSYAV